MNKIIIFGDGAADIFVGHRCLAVSKQDTDEIVRLMSLGYSRNDVIVDFFEEKELYKQYRARVEGVK